MIKLWQIISGYKTYLMIFVGALDAVGVALGWWDEGRLREIMEIALTAAAYRSGIAASGPVVK